VLFAFSRSSGVIVARSYDMSTALLPWNRQRYFDAWDRLCSSSRCQLRGTQTQKTGTSCPHSDGHFLSWLTKNH